MELPGYDYTKANSRWRDRISREDRVHGRSRTGGYEARSVPVKVMGKITRIASPVYQRSRVLEYMSLRDASRLNEEFEFTRSLSPRDRYLLPPSSSKATGWAAPDGSTHAQAKPVVPGLYNWKKGFVKHDPCPSHNLGYVTLVGVDSHPKKKTIDTPEREDSSEDTAGFSVPSMAVREIDNSLRRSVAEHRNYMVGFGKTKWTHPVTMNDISTYGNAYIRAFKSGPFNKTQILVSR